MKWLIIWNAIIELHWFRQLGSSLFAFRYLPIMDLQLLSVWIFMPPFFIFHSTLANRSMQIHNNKLLFDRTNAFVYEHWLSIRWHFIFSFFHKTKFKWMHFWLLLLLRRLRVLNDSEDMEARIYRRLAGKFSWNKDKTKKREKKKRSCDRENLKPIRMVAFGLVQFSNEFNRIHNTSILPSFITFELINDAHWTVK